ncbi:MAG: 6-phosphogluconolactonase, partial [Mycobacterium sp.]
MEARVYDKMPVRIAENASEMALDAAGQAGTGIAEAVSRRGRANAMFATGNSQLAFIDALVALPGIDWHEVTIFHMDEYVGIGADHPAGFRRYIRERLENRVKPATAHYLAGDAQDPDAECRR